MRFVALAAILLFASMTRAGIAAAQSADGAIADWPYYGGDAGGGRIRR